jgi:acyl-CoA dehydrogenase
MPIYKAPVEDVTFLLNDVFQIDRYDNLPGFTDASADVREAILSEAAKLSEEVLQPLNRVGDLEGCKRHDDGSVTTPKGFKEAFKQVAEGGWLGLSAPAEYGGQGLPVTLSQVVTEFQSAANMAFSMRHGSRPPSHQGGQAGRRQLQDHGHQDLHLRRRARSRREHHPSGTGAD